jgi:hypothetical protein
MESTFTSDGSDATASFTSGIDSTYKEYLFVFNSIHPETDNAKLTFQGSTNGGTGYGVTVTTTLFNSYHGESGSFSGLAYDDGADLAQSTNFQEISANVGNDNDTAASGILRLYNPSSTTFVKHFLSTMNIIRDRSQETFVGGYFNTTSAINAVQFKYSSGQIQGGTIDLFGVV